MGILVLPENVFFFAFLTFSILAFNDPSVLQRWKSNERTGGDYATLLTPTVHVTHLAAQLRKENLFPYLSIFYVHFKVQYEPLLTQPSLSLLLEEQHPNKMHPFNYLAHQPNHGQVCLGAHLTTLATFARSRMSRSNCSSPAAHTPQLVVGGKAGGAETSLWGGNWMHQMQTSELRSSGKIFSAML